MSSDLPVRFLRSTDEPFGVFLRPSRTDHRLLLQLLSEGMSSFSGVIFDPTLLSFQQELRSEVNQRRLWSVLDPLSLELSYLSSRTAARKELPWAGTKPLSVADLRGAGGRTYAESIAAFVKEQRYTAVLAPTHYLGKGIADEWFDVDLALFAELRRALQIAGCTDVALYFPLATATHVFFDGHQRVALKSALSMVRPDAVWLRIHPFGASSGHVTLQRYIRACRDWHALGVPLVAERVGTIGVPLLAFGAVSGIEVAVSSGERFNMGSFEAKKKPGKGFAAHRQVYLQNLGVFLKPAMARAFFENHALRSQHQCANQHCCRSGVKDMVGNARRHFLMTRMEELSQINSVPSNLRPGVYMDRYLRPATDKLGRAMAASIAAETREKLERERRRLDGWRDTLGQVQIQEPLTSTAVAPVRRVSAAAA